MVAAMASAKPKDVMIVTMQHDDRQTYLLSAAENRLARRNVPVEPAFVQIGVRKHDVALAVEYVALPFLEAHGAK